MNEEKRNTSGLIPGGKPYKYKGQETCNFYVELSNKGDTDVEIAAKMGVTPQVFYKWAQDHEEFKQARAEGRILSERWYINAVRAKMLGKGEAKNYDLQAAKWIMMNKFGWGENAKNKVTIDEAPKLVIEHVRPEGYTGLKKDGEQ